MEINVRNLYFTYGKNTPFEKEVLHNINLTIPSGSYTAIIGHTGSGKSTLIQHFNGLLQPTNGTVTIGDFVIRSNKKQKQLKQLRKQVGVVFQYPEYQLFEETVLKDICFGPKNFGVSEDEAIKRAKKILPLVGLEEDILEKSPFALSGGQMRRVAIAGILAMEPKVLVLDEPTAGLDPRGQKEIMKMFKRIHDERQLTTVLVTHHMADAALYADQIIVLHKGKMVLSGSPEQIFQDRKFLEQIHLDVPETVSFLYELEKKLNRKLPKNLFTPDDVTNFLVQEIIKQKGK